MTILVAGGAGYIGSHICKALDKKGYNVIVYDNLSLGYRSLAHWGEFVLGDVNDDTQLDLVFDKYNIDAVMHFCAFTQIGESVSRPEDYYYNNVVGTINLIKAMRRHSIDKFVFSSTAALYGNPEKNPIEEEDAKIQINPYGRTKWMIEQILADYTEVYDLNYIAFRYFNAAGADFDSEIGEAHNPESHLIPLVLDAALKVRDNIKIFGTDYDTPDGTCIRDYIHVNDLADVHILGLETLLNGGNSNYFNLGSGNGYSVREVIDTVRKITGIDFPVVETERRAGDPDILVASSNKAKNFFDWIPKYNLKQMVESAWAWHQKLRKNGIK